MHELSLCMDLVDQLADLAGRHGARSVARVELQVGVLSGVEPLLLEAAFPMASAGSLAANAVLVIEAVQPRIRCRRCGGEADAPPNRLVCAICGSGDTELLRGQELILSRVELVRDTETHAADVSMREHHVR